MKTTRVQQTVPALMGVLAASVLIGVAYNSASPLGVRTQPAGSAPATDVTAKAISAPAATAPAIAAPQKGYANQTVAMALEQLPAQPRTTPAPPSVVQQPAPPPTAVPAPPPPAHKPIPAVTWPQVKELVAKGNTVVVDARPAPQYQADHIPGAVSVPAGTPPDAIAALVAKHGKSKTYVVYCGSGQCGLSKTMAEAIMKQGGAEDVRTMPGGYAEFRAAESKPQ